MATEQKGQKVGEVEMPNAVEPMPQTAAPGKKATLAVLVGVVATFRLSTPPLARSNCFCDQREGKAALAVTVVMEEMLAAGKHGAVFGLIGHEVLGMAVLRDHMENWVWMVSGVTTSFNK